MKDLIQKILKEQLDVNSQDKKVMQFVAKKLRNGINQYHTNTTNRGDKYAVGFKIEFGEQNRGVFDMKILSLDLIWTYGKFEDGKLIDRGHLKDVLMDVIAPKIGLKGLNFTHVIINVFDSRPDTNSKRFFQLSFDVNNKHR